METNTIQQVKPQASHRKMCECGNPVSVKHRGVWKCDRCKNIEVWWLRYEQETLARSRYGRCQ